MGEARRFARALWAVVLVVPLIVGGGAAVASTPAPDPAKTIVRDERTAVKYGRAQGMHVGVAVMDTSTGELVKAGVAYRDFMSASVVKTMIATQLLLTGQMTGENKKLAYSMITQSDNDAATALYPLAGGDTLLPTLAAHYDITDLGTAPTSPGAWGTTQITAAGMAQFYTDVRNDPIVWPWLGRAMKHYQPVSVYGEPNDFGIPAAAPASAVKNGWVIKNDGVDTPTAIIHTTGVVQHDRYAVAILTEGPRKLYYVRGEAIVSTMAQLLMPNGVMVPKPA